MSERYTRYFVLHLSERDYRPTPAAQYAIQLSDPEGGPGSAGYIGDAETELVVDGHVVPAAVLDAARRQACGQGDYVDESGETIPPF